MSLIYNASFDSQTRILSLLDKAGNVISSCEVPSKELVDDPNKPLMLRAIANGSSVILEKHGALSNTYQTSTNGTDWTDYTFGTEISLNKGESVYFRCSNHPTTQSFSNYVRFLMAGKIEAWHNAYSMIRSDFSSAEGSVGVYGMNGLFERSSSLTKAPLLVNALSPYCYYGTFFECRALTQAPALPATILANDCYRSMFSGCDSLTQAPALPATILANNCYAYMFERCVSLTQAPALPATTLAGGCYSNMFERCDSLTQAPALPATNLVDWCYSNMFSYCDSLTKAPALPADTLAPQCYNRMFEYSPKLNEVRIAATTTATDALTNWLSGVSSTGDFYCDPNTSWTKGASGIPYGWNRWVRGAEATETTTTMYHNGVAETVRVGTSSYGTCYALQGWVGFRTLDQMHDLIYVLQEPVPTTMYHNGSTETIDKIEANGADGFTEDMYILNSSLKTLSEMHAFGYTLGAQTAITMYDYSDPVSVYSCAANVDDGFTETMYDIGDGEGYLTIAQQNEKGYYLTATPFTGLTLTATADNSSVKLTKNGTLNNTFEVDTGNGWTAYEFGTVIPLNAGQSCRWRCSAHPTKQARDVYVQFVMTGTIEASGNCNSMLDGRKFGSMVSLSGYDYAFYNMFQKCTSLTQAPALPATTLSAYCYARMFSNCESLTQVPVLPATTLADSCYWSLFQGCGLLTKAPELPATKLVIDCYYTMFQGCLSLKEVRVSATKTVTGALTSWLKDVSATGDFYCDPNATIFQTGASGIPANWTRHALADYPVNP